MQRNSLPPTPYAPAQARLVRFDIAPDGIEVAALGAATLLGFAMYWAGTYGTANFLLPLLMTAIPGWGIWRMLRRVPAAIWSSLFAVRAASLVYLGIGGLVPILGGEAAREYIFALYAYSPEEGTKAHALFVAGLFVLIASVKLASIVRPGTAPLRHVTFSQSGSFRLGLVFVALGLGYASLIQIPTQLYWAGLVLPGSIILLMSAIGSIGLFLLTLWAAERGGVAYLLPAALLLVQLLVSAILMEKQTFLMAILLVGLALLLKKFSIPRLGVLAVVLAATLSFLTPAIQQARIVHSDFYGDLTGGSVAERLGHQIRYLQGERIAIIAATEATTFVRLHYTSPSAFVMTQYDLGLPGQSIVNSAYAVIPRLIWPDKPVTSAVGSELNRMITGVDTSALGIVMFADLYWNLGWSGLLLLIPIGWYLWWASSIACAVVTARDWLMMPFVVIAFRVGMSMDNTFVLSWLVPAAISLVAFVLLRFASDLVLSTRPSAAVVLRTPGAAA